MCCTCSQRQIQQDVVRTNVDVALGLLAQPEPAAHEEDAEKIKMARSNARSYLSRHMNAAMFPPLDERKP